MFVIWQIVAYHETDKRVDDDLAKGWEPFAVDRGKLYLRRPITKFSKRPHAESVHTLKENITSILSPTAWNALQHPRRAHYADAAIIELVRLYPDLSQSDIAFLIDRTQSLVSKALARYRKLNPTS